MKLQSVKIHNFRGILEQEFWFNDYSLLVGQNNAGKTTVIDAIRAFYEKDGFKFRQEKDFPRCTVLDQESWIELDFALTEDEFGSLATEYQVASNILRVRKYFITNSKTHDEKPASGLIFAYKANGLLSNEPFYGAKNVQSGKFGDIVYIPAVSKVDDHTKLSGPSALRDLLTDVLSNVIDGSDAYNDFVDNVQKFDKTIRNIETKDGRSLSGFENDLNGLVGSWRASFKVKLTPPSTPEIVKSMIGWDLTDPVHGKEQDIDAYGSGFQRHFIYSIIQLSAKYVSKKVSKKTKDFVPSMTLLLFEEPEAFLHPPQQDILAKSLMSLAATEGWQVLCATHSSHFVSKNADNIPAIIRLCWDNDQIIKHQINSKDWQGIVNTNQDFTNYPTLAKKVSAEDMKPEMEAVKHFLWLSPDRCSLFFADFVLLVEGPTEASLINKMISEDKICSTRKGAYILDCLGKYNIHRFINLLTNFGIYHSVLYDDDNNENEHRDLNNLIEASKDPKYTIKSQTLTSDLETYLAVPPAGAPHRKPQHMLFLYESKQIDEIKMNNFSKLIEACF